MIRNAPCPVLCVPAARVLTPLPALVTQVGTANLRKRQLSGAGSTACSDLSAYFLSIGLCSCCHKLNPPSKAAALSIPFVLRATTAPADVCSACQEQ